MTNRDREQPEELIAREARHDHAKAQARGQRIQDLADFCVSELIAEGYLPSEHRIPASVVLFQILADDIYPLVSVDLPPRPKEDRP
jgi:hypothetical protein